MEDLLRAGGGTAGEALGLGAGAQKEAISRWIVAARGRYCASCKLNEQIQSNKRFCFVNLFVCECECTCMYVCVYVVCVYVYVCMCVCMCVCMYVNVCM